jgi:hypothetical protein
VFTETADLYDLVYSFKDYPAEVARLRGMGRGLWLATVP